MTARRLASRKLIMIVALGSSSTAGAGASSVETTYPSRLMVELAQPIMAMRLLRLIELLARSVRNKRDREIEDVIARVAERLRRVIQERSAG
jgi:hypothetical protein